MERLERPATRALPKVRVYLDDLHTAAEILKEESLHFGDISVALDSHPHRLGTLDKQEVEELMSSLRKSRVHSLQITASPPEEEDPPSATVLKGLPDIVIDFARDHASITSTKDSVQGLGLLDKLEEHFGHCKRNEWAIWAIGPVVYVLFIVLLFQGVLDFGSSDLGGWAGFVVGLLPVLGFVAAWFVGKLIPHSTIVLAKKADAPTWFERRREDLAMEVVKTGISGAIGVIIGFFVGSSSSP